LQPIDTDRVAWSVCLSVGPLVTFVSPAKAAEPIEMPFGGINGVQILQKKGAILGVVLPMEKHGYDGSIYPIVSRGKNCGRQNKLP